MKRILALILSVILIISTLPAVVFAENAKFSVSEEKIDLLIHLGIVEEPTDETLFDVEVTRADFAVYLGNIIGINEKNECNKRYYTDLPEDHWAYNTINTMTEMGYLSGTNGKFNPDDSITYIQAIAMILNSLGYKDIAQSRGGWTNGYIAVAQDLEISAIGSGQNENITFATVCELLHDALLAPILEYKTMSKDGATVVVNRDKTVMERYYDIYRVTGIVNSVNGIKIDAGEDGKEGVIRIDDTEYACELPDAIDFLGHKVYAYYDNSGDEEKVFLISSREDNVGPVINIDEFHAFDPEEFAISYIEDGKSRIKKQKIARNATVIKNYEDYSSDVSQAFDELSYGSIQLLRSKDSREYDVVIIKNYTDMVVSSFDKAYEKIYDKKDPENVLDLTDIEKYRIMDSEGQVINLSEVGAGTVLSVCKSNNYCEIIANTVTYSGNVKNVTESENGKYMVVPVGEEDVPVDMAYYNANTTMFQYGSKVKVFMNVFGFGTYAELMTSDEFLIGWLIKAKAVDEMDSICNMTILTHNNKIEKFKCAEIVRSSRRKLTEGSQIETKLGGSPVSGQLIRYKLDENGKINAIETADGLNSTTNYELYQSGSTIESARYYSTNMMMGPTIKLTASTLCFTIPNDATDYDGYEVLKGSELANDRGYSRITPYKTTDATNTTEILVLRESTTGSWGRDMYLVEDVYDIINEDDEIETVADVYVNGIKKTVKAGRGFSFEESGVTSGDIWHFYTYSNGEIAPADNNYLRVIYDFETEKVKDINNGFSYEPYIGFGYITSIKNGVARYGCVVDSDDYVSYEEDESLWTNSGILSVAGVPVTVYDSEEGKAQNGDESDLYEAMQKGYIIFVAQTFGAVNSVVVIKR